MASLDLDALSRVSLHGDMSDAIAALRQLSGRRTALPAPLLAFIERGGRLFEIDTKVRSGRVFLRARLTKTFSDLLGDIDKT